MESNLKNFSRATQLASIALDGVLAGTPLFALPFEHGLPEFFSALFPRLHFLYHDYSIYLHDRELVSSLAFNTVKVSFAPRWEETGEAHDLAIIYLPKSAELIEFVFSSVSETLERDARVMLVGPKRSAIRSSRPIMEKYFGEIVSSSSARHCVLIESRKTVKPEPFEGTRKYPVEAFGKKFEVTTLPGVFSHGHLDEGTKFLFDHVGELKFEEALDWGCGAGVIGVGLMLAHPEKHVDLVDSDVMAIEAARRTLESNGFSADSARPSDIFSDVNGKYDLIITNPPFHAGLKTDTSTTEQMVCEAGKHVTPSGRLVMVTNKFINYFPQLQNSFGQVRTIAENRKYRIIEAKNPRRIKHRK